jgi:hypothetical protein
LPACDGDVDVTRIDLDQKGLPPCLFGGDQGGPGAAERIEDDAVAVRTIADRINDKGDRLDRGVQRELALRSAAEDVLARIIPDIGSVAAEAAEFNVVDVRRISTLEHKNQLML